MPFRHGRIPGDLTVFERLKAPSLVLSVVLPVPLSFALCGRSSLFFFVSGLPAPLACFAVAGVPPSSSVNPELFPLLLVKGMVMADGGPLAAGLAPWRASSTIRSARFSSASMRLSARFSRARAGQNGGVKRVWGCAAKREEAVARQSRESGQCARTLRVVSQ